MGEEPVANTKKFHIARIDGKDRTGATIEIVREFTMTVFVNDKEFASLSCSPADLEYLAVGFVFSQGLIRNREDITDIKSDKSGKVWLYTSAEADCLIRKPEGVELLKQDQMVTVQILRKLPAGISGTY